MVTVTVQDSDLDTSTAADTAVTFDNDGGAQTFMLTPNLADTNGDGNVNSDDFSVRYTPSNATANAEIAVIVLDVPSGIVTLLRRSGVAPGDLPGGALATVDLLVSSEFNTVQVTCPPKTDPTLELEFWKRRKGRYGTQEVHT